MTGHEKSLAKEYPYSGFCIAGFGALALAIIMFVFSGWCFSFEAPLPVLCGGLLVFLGIVLMIGLTKLEPNES